jgi:transcriptional regulator with XRE-family HTH domain
MSIVKRFHTQLACYYEKNILHHSMGGGFMTLQELFISNLKDYRKSLKISQLKLAEKCDTTQTYIAEIEVGRKFPSLKMIERIADALNIESYYLFRNEPIKTDTKKRCLSPSQKREIVNELNSAAIKIINKY